MSSKVRNLFGRASTSRPNGEQTQDELVREICQLYSKLLGERVERMFAGADDLLFEMVERATSNVEQAVYLDTMRAVRLERPRLTVSFNQGLRACFLPGYKLQEPALPDGRVDFDSLSLQDNATLEQNIAVVNMATKAASLFSYALRDLERRLEYLIEKQGAKLSPLALSPNGLCEAFRTALEPLNVELDIKLVIYKLFDRLVIGSMGPVYQELLGLLDRHGIAAPAAAPATAAAAGSAHLAPGLTVGPGKLPKIDANTLGSLRYLASGGMSNGSMGYSDAMLASDLAHMASGQVFPGMESAQTWALMQKAELVGRMFNNILTDSSIPDAYKPLFEELRFPVIKTAIRDAHFFSDDKHPVRSFINELSALAASTRNDSHEAHESLQTLAQQVRQRFDPAAEMLRPTTLRPQPVPQADIERFLEEQLAQGRERRRAIIDKARKIVAQELQLAMLGHTPVRAVMPLLHSGWAPMMGVTLLRHGMDSSRWSHGIHLLSRILSSVDLRGTDAKRALAREGLEPDIRGRFDEVAMPGDTVDRLIVTLIAAWHEADAGHTTAGAGSGPAAPPSDPAAPVNDDPRPVNTERQLLDLLLTPSAWFRVFDNRSGETRWLKLIGWDVEAQLVSFGEFDTNHPLALSAAQLYHDLMLRRSEPIDPTPAARSALEQHIVNYAPLSDHPID